MQEIGRPRGGVALLALALMGLIGCATGKEDKNFTSGDREADLRGAASVENSKKTKGNGEKIVEKKATLYERLGGEPRIRLIVDDFVKRALEDPRVNWARKGESTGGILRRDRSVEWSATPENVTRLKEHLVQFISLASGGPTRYDGQPIKTTHRDMQISKAEFDAAIGDLKATLDKFDVPDETQKDLLAIFESTRSEIVPKK